MVAWIVRVKVWPSLPVSVHFNSKPGVGASSGMVSVIDRASAAILAWVIVSGRSFRCAEPYFSLRWRPHTLSVKWLRSSAETLSSGSLKVRVIAPGAVRQAIGRCSGDATRRTR